MATARLVAAPQSFRLELPRDHCSADLAQHGHDRVGQSGLALCGSGRGEVGGAADGAGATLLKHYQEQRY
jgi:hypothetical protein